MNRKTIFVVAAVFLFSVAALTACGPFRHGLGGGCENPAIDNIISMTGR